MFKVHFWLLALLASVSGAQATVVDFDDALRRQQWYLDAMRFPQAWGLIYDLPQRARITSAVLDSGADTDHADLRDNLLSGYNVQDKNDNVFAANAHGTATLGLMAASSGNGTGITRAAFTSPVIPVQITNRSDGAAYVGSMISAIVHAVDAGARVINLSYTGVNLSSIAEAGRYAKQHGALVFMAAGNDGQTHADWQNWTWLVAVGSVDSSLNVSDFSSRGSFVDFVAPGESILSTRPDDTYSTWNGTSFASPLAASVASLMLTANPTLSSGQIIKILRATATDLGPAGVDEASGYGLINAEAAVRLAIDTTGKWKSSRLAEPIEWDRQNLASLDGLQLQLSATVPEPGVLLLLLALGIAPMGWRGCGRDGATAPPRR